MLRMQSCILVSFYLTNVAPGVGNAGIWATIAPSSEKVRRCTLAWLAALATAVSTLSRRQR
jgi:hypothetical protein